jgi:hypothetical protein
MDIETTTKQVGRGAAALTGKAMETAFAVAARVRPAAKPVHPKGALYAVTIERSGLADETGVPWIDEPGRSAGLARISKAIGTPGPLPDVYGLALRLPLEDGAQADILFATTGLGRLTRFVLLPAVGAEQRSYSTLLPYRTEAGPLLLAARPVDADSGSYDLSCASPGGRWRSFATMTLNGTASEASPSFDPVLNQLPGLEYYDWAARVREGAYSAARRSRTDD